MNEIHNQILGYFLAYKESHRDFTFATRVNNRNDRLSNGYWFLGNDDYAFVPLFKRGDDDNKTKTIGFVYKPHDSYIEITFKNVKGMDTSERRFYEEILALLPNHQKQGAQNKFWYIFQEDNLEDNLKYFLEIFRPKCLELIKKYQLQDKYIITENELQNNLNKISEYKNIKEVTRENLLKAIVDFEHFGIRDGYQHPRKHFFKLDGKDTLYPRKYIVLRARESIDLDNTNYTTDQAKNILNKIFGESIRHVNNESNYKEEFRVWWYGDKSLQRSGDVYDVITKDAYFRELERLNDMSHSGENIFLISDIDELNDLLERLEAGDLKEYNRRNQNTDPSNGLRQYIKFHKSLKGIIENSTIITMEKNTMELNTILFGPPGTGKTFSSMKKALEIIDGAVSQDHSEAKQRFETLQESGQISMVTFHQSYGYEEFVEGLKANTVDGHISYDVEAGAFKIIAERALSNYESYQEASRNTIVKDLIDIELLLNDFSNFVSEELAQDKQVLLTVNGSFPNPSYIGVVNRFSDDNFRSFSTVGGATNQSLTKNIIIRDYQEFFDGKITDYKDIKPRYESQSSYHGNGIYYYELYCVLKDFQEQNPGKYIIKNKDIELKKYILIIDEINRGNISKVFGELITLIEPSKRIGASDEIRVNLPYSERENSFGIPSNLYIIGTMNTADRSIALLDTALRRRFNFIEMMPDIELIEEKVGLIDGIDVSNILQRINKRIEVLYDRDHMIGHAYFLDIRTFEDLVSVMKNKIIPLLQEYFYDDWQKITMVFNNNGFIKESSIDAEILFSNVEYDFDDDQKIYSLDLKALEDPETYQKI